MVGTYVKIHKNEKKKKKKNHCKFFSQTQNYLFY